MMQMQDNQNCSGCIHKNDCQEVYEKLGQVQGPSVALKAVIAFLVPIVIFIVVLALSGHIFSGIFEKEDASIAASAAVAMLASLFFALGARLYYRRGRDEQHGVNHCSKGE